MEDEATDEGFIGYPCYEFNRGLPADRDDTRCVHCRKYLTLECEYLDEFLEDSDEL